MSMVNDNTRREVWSALLDVSRLTLYYSKLADRHRRWHIAIRFALAFSAMGSISAAITDLFPVWVKTIFDVLIAVFVAWDLVVNYTKKIVVLNKIRDDLMDAQAHLNKLWSQVYYVGNTDLTNSEVQEKILESTIRVNEVTQLKNTENIRNSNRLNEKCAEQSYKTLGDKYAAKATYS